MTILESIYETVEAAQERLSITCIRIQFVWCHQVIYAIVVLCAVHISLDVWWAENAPVHTRRNGFHLSYVFWHGLLSLLMFTTAFVVPAGVTGIFVSAPRDLFVGLRRRGISI